MTATDQLLAIAKDLGRVCDTLSFGPAAPYVYNPLAYAWDPYQRYLRRFARAGVDAVLVGMNPGPFGMLQTGVPFGDLGMVRDWLGIDGVVKQPPRLHPKRPVQGFAIRRGEVSGRRVWGWARERFGNPDAFFERFFVTNYCPLGFFNESGANVTPDALRGPQRDALYAACDHALAVSLRILQPRAAIGVGRFAEQRLQSVAPPQGVRVVGVTHPSPANPRAHGGWTPHMDAVAQELGIGYPSE